MVSACRRFDVLVDLWCRTPSIQMYAHHVLPRLNSAM